MRIKLIRANCLNEIFHSLLDFVILRLELFGLGGDPFALHLDKFIKSVG